MYYASYIRYALQHKLWSEISGRRLRLRRPRRAPVPCANGAYDRLLADAPISFGEAAMELRALGIYSGNCDPRGFCLPSAYRLAYMFGFFATPGTPVSLSGCTNFGKKFLIVQV